MAGMRTSEFCSQLQHWDYGSTDRKQLEMNDLRIFLSHVQLGDITDKSEVLLFSPDSQAMTESCRLIL